jgi:hypothetical protein
MPALSFWFVLRIACEIFPTGNTACILITSFVVFPELRRLFDGIASTGTPLGSNLLRLTYNKSYLSLR